jgi:hypothetical protein
LVHAASLRAVALLSSCVLIVVGCKASTPQVLSTTQSLTGAEYKGTKRFFGFAEVDERSERLGNETRFDVTHMREVFTSAAGGSYQGSAIVQGATRETVLAGFDQAAAALGPDDMYVQYSAGHGLKNRLNLWIGYDEMRDRIMALKAKEVIVFMMACHSGGLIESFNRLGDGWKADWRAKGRTLFVMSSSTTEQLSSVGPQVDPAEGVDVVGNGGSAFGHVLWRAIRGEADSSGDKVVTLGELVSFVTVETGKVAAAAQGARPDGKPFEQAPQVFGLYSDDLPITSPSSPNTAGAAEWKEAKRRYDEARAPLSKQLEELEAKIAAIPRPPAFEADGGAGGTEDAELERALQHYNESIEALIAGSAELKALREADERYADTVDPATTTREAFAAEMRRRQDEYFAKEAQLIEQFRADNEALAALIDGGPANAGGGVDTGDALTAQEEAWAKWRDMVQPIHQEIFAVEERMRQLETQLRNDLASILAARAGDTSTASGAAAGTDPGQTPFVDFAND